MSEEDPEVAAMRDHLRLLKALGAPVMIVAEVTGAVHGERGTPASRRPTLSEKEWGTFGKRLTEVGDVLAREGMPLVYHHHMGTVVQSGDDVRQLMEVTGPSVHLLLDTGHLTYAGSDPIEVAKHNGITVVGLLGKGGGKAKNLVDIPIIVPRAETSDRIQEIHIKVIHIVIETVEREMFPRNYS